MLPYPLHRCTCSDIYLTVLYCFFTGGPVPGMGVPMRMGLIQGGVSRAVRQPLPAGRLVFLVIVTQC